MLIIAKRGIMEVSKGGAGCFLNDKKITDMLINSTWCLKHLSFYFACHWNEITVSYKILSDSYILRNCIDMLHMY